jgi:flagellar hook-length control protein FliK
LAVQDFGAHRGQRKKRGSKSLKKGGEKVRMIPNVAVFPDVATVATPQSGKATPSAAQGSDKSGDFAKVLQVSRLSNGGAASEAAPGDAAASSAKLRVSRGALAQLKRRNSGQAADPQKTQQLQVVDAGQEPSVSQPGQAKEAARVVAIDAAPQDILTAGTAQNASSTSTASSTVPGAVGAQPSAAGAAGVTAGSANILTAVSPGNRQQNSGIVVLAAATQVGQVNIQATAQQIPQQEQVAVGGEAEAEVVRQQAPAVQAEQIVLTSGVAVADNGPDASRGGAAGEQVVAPAAQEASVQNVGAPSRRGAQQVVGAAEPMARQNAANADLQKQSATTAVVESAQPGPNPASEAVDSEPIVQAKQVTDTEKDQDSFGFTTMLAPSGLVLASAAQPATQEVAVAAGRNSQQELDVTAPGTRQRSAAAYRQPEQKSKEATVSMDTTLSAVASVAAGQDLAAGSQQIVQKTAAQSPIAATENNAQQDVGAAVPGARQSAAAAYQLPAAAEAMAAAPGAVETAGQGHESPLPASQSTVEQVAAAALQHAGLQTAVQDPVAAPVDDTQQETAATTNVAAQSSLAADGLTDEQGIATTASVLAMSGPVVSSTTPESDSVTLVDSTVDFAQATPLNPSVVAAREQFAALAAQQLAAQQPAGQQAAMQQPTVQGTARQPAAASPMQATEKLVSPAMQEAQSIPASIATAGENAGLFEQVSVRQTAPALSNQAAAQSAAAQSTATAERVAGQAAPGAETAADAPPAMSTSLPAAAQSRQPVQVETETVVDNRQSVARVASLQSAPELVAAPAAQAAEQATQASALTGSGHAQTVIAPDAKPAPVVAGEARATASLVPSADEVQQSVAGSNGVVAENVVEVSPIQASSELEMATAALPAAQVSAVQTPATPATVASATAAPVTAAPVTAAPVTAAPVTVTASPATIGNARQDGDTAVSVAGQSSRVTDTIQAMPRPSSSTGAAEPVFGASAAKEASQANAFSAQTAPELEAAPVAQQAAPVTGISGNVGITADSTQLRENAAAAVARPTETTAADPVPQQTAVVTADTAQVTPKVQAPAVEAWPVSTVAETVQTTATPVLPAAQEATAAQGSATPAATGRDFVATATTNTQQDSDSTASKTSQNVDVTGTMQTTARPTSSAEVSEPVVMASTATVAVEETDKFQPSSPQASDEQKTAPIAQPGAQVAPARGDDTGTVVRPSVVIAGPVTEPTTASAAVAETAQPMQGPESAPAARPVSSASETVQAAPVSQQPEQQLVTGSGTTAAKEAEGAFQQAGNEPQIGSAAPPAAQAMNRPDSSAVVSEPVVGTSTASVAASHAEQPQVSSLATAPEQQTVTAVQPTVQPAAAQNDVAMTQVSVQQQPNGIAATAALQNVTTANPAQEQNTTPAVAGADAAQTVAMQEAAASGTLPISAATELAQTTPAPVSPAEVGQSAAASKSAVVGDKAEIVSVQVASEPQIAAEGTPPTAQATAAQEPAAPVITAHDSTALGVTQHDTSMASSAASQNVEAANTVTMPRPASSTEVAEPVVAASTVTVADTETKQATVSLSQAGSEQEAAPATQPAVQMTAGLGEGMQSVASTPDSAQQINAAAPVARANVATADPVSQQSAAPASASTDTVQAMPNAEFAASAAPHDSVTAEIDATPPQQDSAMAKAAQTAPTPGTPVAEIQHSSAGTNSMATANVVDGSPAQAVAEPQIITAALPETQITAAQVSESEVSAAQAPVAQATLATNDSVTATVSNLQQEAGAARPTAGQNFETSETAQPIVVSEPVVTAGAATIPAPEMEQLKASSPQTVSELNAAPAAPQTAQATAAQVDTAPQQGNVVAATVLPSSAAADQAPAQTAAPESIPATAGNMQQAAATVAPGARQSAAAAYLFPEQTAVVGEAAGTVQSTSQPIPVTEVKGAAPTNAGTVANKRMEASAQEQNAAPALQQPSQGPAAQAPVTTTESDTSQEVSAPAAGPSVETATSNQAPTAAATEATQKELPVSGEKSKASTATAAVAAQPIVEADAPAAEAASTSDKGTQPVTDKRDTRSAEGGQKQQKAGKGGAEQVGVAPKAEDASGTKLAQTNTTAKAASAQGSESQTGSGDADKRGRSGQQTQNKVSDQVQPTGVGVQAPVVAEVALPEAKPVNLKSALQESILSQIKDGVVTHDGKGNGQMSIRLNPGELGELKIDIRMQDNRLKVDVQATNSTVKDLLMNNLENLKEALTSKNFTMEGFNVSTGGGGFNSPLPEQKRSPRQQSAARSAKAGGYSDQDEVRVNYLTGDVNNLLDVRF